MTKTTRKTGRKSPRSPKSKRQSSAGILKFLAPGNSEWHELSADADKEDNKGLERAVENSRTTLKEALLTALQMPNLIALSGSGTSIGSVGGPSMRTLWGRCVHKDPDTERESYENTETASNVIETIKFDEAEEGQNIEALLSRCEAFLVIHDQEEVEQFAVKCKQIILESCSGFLTGDAPDLEAHRQFLHRLSRRRVRDPRLKLFTTNYDLCFEIAAAELGLVGIDGFSFSTPRRFSPTHFTYDIVRRSSVSAEIGEPLAGVFHLLKLHGSVNWASHADGRIVECSSPNPNDACLIYPARGKYQQSYSQPHLELMSQFLSALRQPDTCLFIAGFGFNDDHLSEPIYTAVRSNPQLQLVIADYKAEDSIYGIDGDYSPYWKKLHELSSAGENVWFINGSFADFCKLIPNLRALTPGQKLEQAIKGVTR